MARTDQASLVVETRTVREIAVCFEDHTLDQIGPNDEIVIVLRGRGRDIHKRLNYREAQHLLGAFNRLEHTR